MNQKALISILALLILIAVGWYVYGAYKAENPTLTDEEAMDALPAVNDRSGGLPDETNEDREVRGTITAVDTSKTPVDGPVLITLRTESEGTVVIAVPSMGLPMCAAYASMDDAFALKAGQEIEVRGSEGTENRIVPCTSADHYLRVIE